MICGVIIDKEAKELNKEFDYIIPNELTTVVSVGVRVKVPFRNQVLLGYVVSIKEKSDFSNLKSVIECLDIFPVFTEEMIDIAKKMSIKTSSYISSYLNLMLPKGLKAKYKKVVRQVRESIIPDNIDYNLVDLKLLKQEIKLGNVRIEYDFLENAKVKEDNYIELISDSYIPKTNNEKIILELLNLNPVIKRSELAKEGSNYTVNSLIKKEVVRIIKIADYRRPKVNPYYKKVELSDEQKKAISEFKDNDVFLLHGVTGSGKTEVYLELIEEVIKERNVIFLVPEIALTPMFSNRLIGRFQDKVAVLHSKLSVGEKYDEYRRILEGKVNIVVGPRSAIFAPLKNIGLIIVDEEHEDSYIQDVYPKYNAIDIALFRNSYNNSKLILGSATPNVSHYKYALDKKYKLIELKNRAIGKLPKITLVDMKEELVNQNKSIFSRLLINKIEERLKNKEQTILLLNRRGYASFVMCRSCGEVVKCDSCDISLTYHQHDNFLKCHYCGMTKSNVLRCEKCGSDKIKQVGLGTERVEEELKSIFKDIKTLRMDLDTVSKKHAAEEILDQFKKGEADVLIGTQMIAKGLDFENVTLVGVISADLQLKLPGYKMAEKTFDLINQVSGRSGRHKDNGEAVIQGYDIDNYAIKTAVRNDYEAFYNTEIKIRKIASYPPFTIMKRIIFMHKDLETCFREANKIKNRFNEVNDNLYILGPTTCDISKIKNVYRVQLILKYNDINIDDLLFKLVEFYNEREISIEIDEL